MSDAMLKGVIQLPSLSQAMVQNGIAARCSALLGIPYYAFLYLYPLSCFGYQFH